ncbi:NKAP domain containing 1 [Hoplias malabaricus]|uniref:NKAP domain containing 1 n=1 Tax=Hoplias malabaricus TaxID=27720 RepID=UPI0034620809
MSRVPMGKVLLRNVIRHTDAHNKIQEESEMWKLRDMERQSSSAEASKHRWVTSHLERSNMRCDRYLDDSEGSARDRLGEKTCLSEKDEREARYWSRKLYEFEANDPDRWGHSGFKELYPEEFHSDGETDCKEKGAARKRKDSKKSSKKKKKKKKKRRHRAAGSGSESDNSTTDSIKRKQKKKSGKSKHGRKKEHKSKAQEKNGSSEDGESDRHRETAHRKRHRTAADTQMGPERKKRKDWKANEEKSEDSSED